MNDPNLIPRNEDGTLDIKLILLLPIDDFEIVMENMTFKESKKVFSYATPAKGPVKPVLVDYSSDDLIDWGWGVDADKFLKRMREKIDKLKGPS